jgi:hypothetical protein
MDTLWDTTDLDTYLTSIINEDNIEEQLVQESRWKIGYRDSQLERRNLLGKYDDVMELAPRDLQWDELGVSDQARGTLANNDVESNQLHTFFAHPSVLIEIPHIFDYYRSLAGVSENRLRDMDSIKPAIRELRNDSKSLGPSEPMTQLCRYLNSLISTWASSITDRTPEQRALISALLTEGAAIEGSSRNAGGRKAVVNVASVIVEDLDEQGYLDSFIVKQTSKDEFVEILAIELGDTYALSDLSGAYDVREVVAENGGVVNVDVGEPDMVVSSPDNTTGFGEIKDRKDVSNQWEGWLPLIRSKLVDFKQRDPSAKRMILQPVFTERMIDGERGSDAEDVGVRGFIEDNQLDLPVNISQIIADEDSRDFFGAYIRSLLGYCVGDLFYSSN